MLSGKPFCRRCLLADLPTGAELAATVREWVSQIPPDRRAPAETVARRLGVCRQCDHLRDGLCALCGCYVEYRAEGASARCPDLPDRWQT